MGLLSRKIELCREYIEVYTILEPGLTKWKGRVRYLTVIFSFCMIVCICYVICSPLTPKRLIMLTLNDYLKRNALFTQREIKILDFFLTKEFSLCRQLLFSNSYICANQCRTS